MILIITVVFFALFAVTMMIGTALRPGPSKKMKQALAILDSALVISAGAPCDEVPDIRRREVLSSLPWLNRFLTKLDMAPTLRRVLKQGNSSWTVGGLLLRATAAGVFVTYAVYLRCEVLLLAVVLGSIGGSIPFIYVFWKRSKRFGRFEQNLPDALDMIVGALRAGHSLVAAIGIVGREAADPVGPEFRICFDEQNFGMDFRAVMLNLIARTPVQDVRIVVTAMLIQKESGGNLAEILDKVACITRDRYRLKKQIQVHTAQGRLTGWVLALLPVGLGLGLYLFNPTYMSVLWERPIGQKMMYTSAIMTCVGSLIIRSIIRIRV